MSLRASRTGASRLKLTVGFVGLHAAQKGRLGRLGTAGLAIVLVGFTIIVAGSVGEFWVFSAQPYDGAGFARGVCWAIWD
jgi:hypothetical protein